MEPITPEQLPAFIEASCRAHCRWFGLDPDEIVDAAKLMRQPEGVPPPTEPQMLARWQLHQPMVLTHFKERLSFDYAFQEGFRSLNPLPDIP